jgi:hypothetical protein
LSGRIAPALRVSSRQTEFNCGKSKCRLYLHHTNFGLAHGMTSLFAEGVGDGNKKDLPPQYARNPLKTLNSEEAAKGNERK